MDIQHICVRQYYLIGIFVAISFTVNAQTYDFSKEAARWLINDSLSAILPDSVIRTEYPIHDSLNHVASGEPFSMSATTDSHSHIPASITIDTNMSVGEIPFSSGISPTGAVMYAVPVKAIAGRNGFQPDISITYNSQGGNDVLGYGWSVAGLSSIYRVNKSIYYDGMAFPVALRSDDAFMLDGTRLLPTGNQIYTYVPEQGNMRIEANVISSGIINSFKVEYPNGSIGTFSYTNNLSYPITHLQDAMGDYMDFTYEMIDNRNYIKTIEYGGHLSLPIGHLSSIEFIYKSRSDTVSGYQSGVELKLTQLLEKIRCYDKGDVLRTYSFTYQEGKVPLLAQINQNNLNPLRFYYGYSDDSTSKTLLKQESTLYTYFNPKTPVVVSKGKFNYGADDDGLIIYPDKNPCALFYQPYVPGHHSKAYYYSEFSPEQDLLVNLYLNSSSPIAAVLKAEDGFQTLMSADIDGVPGEEVIKINNVEIDGEDELRIKVYKSNLPSTLYLKSEFTYRSTGVPHNDSRSFWPKIYLPGDYNGDGKMELLTVSMMYPLDRQGLESKCCLIDLSTNRILFNQHVFNFDVQNSQIIPLDVDGDGKTDICHIHTGGMDVYRFTNVNGSYTLSKFFTYTDLKYPSVRNRAVMLGDVNGDGKADIVVSPGKSYTQWGSRIVETRTQDCCPECYADYPNNPICPECNADIGYSSYCAICGTALIGGVECPEHGFYYPVEMMIPYHNGTVWTSYVSTGIGFSKKEQDLMECNRDYNYVLQDVNSDGIADLVECGTKISVWFNECGEFKVCNDFVGGMWGYNVVPSSIVRQNYHCFLLATDGPKLCKINCTINESKQRLLTGIISSLGVVQKNYYRRINDSNIQNDFYHQGYEATFPYEDFQGPLWAASQQKKTLNEICVYDYTYSYGQAIWHRQGLGFRGFTNVYSYDLLRLRENSAQTFDPYKSGALVKEVTPVSETNYTNYMSVASNKRVVVRPTNVLTKDLLKGTYVTRNINYDDYSNPTFEQVQYNDNVTSNVIKTEVSYTYKNLATTEKYLVGLPLTQTTTEYRDGDTRMQSEEIEYKDNTSLPKRKISKVNGNQVCETQWIYSSYGNVLAKRSMAFSSTVLLGKTFIYDYDWRFLSEETDALGHTTTYSSYNKFGSPRIMKNFKQKTTTYDYDGLGRVSSVHNPDGTLESTTYTWDTAVGVYYITQSITGKPLVKIYYDALNREVRKGEQRFDGVWQYVDTQYDDYGRVSKISNPFRTSSSHWTTNSYDDYDRLISVTEPSGKVTTTNYSGNNVTVVQNEISTTRTYDKSGLLITASDPAGDIVYHYRPDRQLNKIMAPGNIETSFDYDSYGGKQNWLILVLV